MTTARFRFTPSMQSGDTLEELFVAREGLLDSAMAAVREAGAGEHRAHKLFVGPRGAGKTHLIALVHHRAQALRAEGLRIQVAWLVEDPWDIDSYAEFLEAILDAIPDDVERPHGSPEAAVLASVDSGGPIVVLAENFDRILTAIGADGQRKLRALLENSNPLLLMATATRLSDDVARQDEPFYGFFGVTHLEPFGVEDAAAMLIALAKHENNQAQLDLLDRPEAARRLATIAHLAGGQPRVWALLGPALQTAGIEDLVTNLLSRVDDLTPYYQEQLAHLSPQEARVVRRMSAHDQPLTVRGIAELVKLDQRSVGKTISDLRRRGWIKHYSSAITELADKRHSYYVLAEPLARLAFQVKESRGEPIQLVVQFIASWHDSELAAGNPAGPTAQYLRSAERRSSEAHRIARALVELNTQASYDIWRHPERPVNTEARRVLESIDEALNSLASGEPKLLLELPAPIIDLLEHALSTTSLLEARRDIARLATRWQVDWRTRLDRLDSNDLWTNTLRISQQMHFGTPAAVQLLVDAVVDEIGPTHPVAFEVRISLGLTHIASGSHQEGLAIIEAVVREEEHALGKDHPFTAVNRDMRDEVRALVQRTRETG